MSSLKDLISYHPDLMNRSIISGYRGSIAHGMYVPPKDPSSIDDKDLMYIVAPSIEHYYGLKNFGSKGTKEVKKEEWDIVAYEVRKFIGLLAKGNPNVLTMLWLEPNYYLNVSDAGKVLIKNRNLFVGRHVYHEFVGYAYGQLHRMTHNAFQGHMGDKRRHLVQKFGFDTKNAAHLIRLLRMGMEFMKDGKLNVLRQDASQLLEIKKGEWSMDKIVNESNRLFASAEKAYIESTLPEGPDMEKINNLSVQVLRTAMREFGDY